jgi:methionine-rich copper-binding protein CopC
MTFTPSDPLAPTTLFTVTITSDAKDLAGNGLSSDRVWSFTTGATPDTTPPNVSSTDPSPNATGVALNQQIAATFSEAMDALTMITTNFTVTGPGSTSVTGTVSYVGTTATFTPSSTLAPNTEFTARVGTDAKDLAGNAIAAAFVWSFTTGATPDTSAPSVSSTDPADNETNVPLNHKIAATFSETMNPATLTTATVLVTGPGSAPVSGTVDYVGATMTFTPLDPLASSTLFTVTVTTDAQDLAGNALLDLLGNRTWSFTTGAAPDTTPPTVTDTTPVDGATNVALNKAFAASFDEAIDPNTITSVTMNLTGPGNTTVPGTLSYDFSTRIASFKPLDNLAPNAAFTAKLVGGSGGVKDLAGNPLASDNAWTFTTGTQLAQAPIDLGAASAFAVMATASITSTGATHIDGDVGLNPGTAQGNPAEQVNGSIHVNDQASADARAALLNAYNEVVNRADTFAPLPANIGGMTFTPGLYTSASSLLISGVGQTNTVTLDAEGDPNAVFIFQMGTTLTTGAGAEIILVRGAKASNVFWQLGTSATIAANTIFKGSVLASVTITVGAGSAIDGRLLAGASTGGSVTLDSTRVSVPA